MLFSILLAPRIVTGICSMLEGLRSIVAKNYKAAQNCGSPGQGLLSFWRHAADDHVRSLIKIDQPSPGGVVLYLFGTVS